VESASRRPEVDSAGAPGFRSRDTTVQGGGHERSSRRERRPYTRCVSFCVEAEEYDRFMGRYSLLLAPRFAEFAGVQCGQRVIDVGCGPGALVAELIRRLRPDAVWAVDPSERFVSAVGARYPGVRVQPAAAQELPFEDRLFDAALAQLVVHFMADPVTGLREMARVTRPRGVVADVEHPSFEEWWEPFLLGVGPAGAYVARLDSRRQARLRELCRAKQPEEPFVISALAWAARGLA